MTTLRKIQTFLSGKKTYLGMIAGGILGLLWSSGLVTDQTAQTLAVLVATWTGVSLRAAIGKG